MKIELDLTPEQAEKVKKMLAGEKKEEKEEWIKEGDEYYTLDSIGVDFSFWDDVQGDEYCMDRSNVYRTKEAAEQAERQRLALGSIHQYVRENGIRMAGFNGYVPDFETYVEKFFIEGWHFGCKEPQTYSDFYVDSSSNGLTFETRGDRQKVFDNCKKELEDLLKVDYSIIR